MTDTFGFRDMSDDDWEEFFIANDARLSLNDEDFTEITTSTSNAKTERGYRTSMGLMSRTEQQLFERILRETNNGKYMLFLNKSMKRNDAYNRLIDKECIKVFQNEIQITDKGKRLYEYTKNEIAKFNRT